MRQAGLGQNQGRFLSLRAQKHICIKRCPWTIHSVAWVQLPAAKLSDCKVQSPRSSVGLFGQQCTVAAPPLVRGEPGKGEVCPSRLCSWLTHVCFPWQAPGHVRAFGLLTGRSFVGPLAEPEPWEEVLRQGLAGLPPGHGDWSPRAGQLPADSPWCRMCRSDTVIGLLVPLCLAGFGSQRFCLLLNTEVDSYCT